MNGRSHITTGCAPPLQKYPLAQHSPRRAWQGKALWQVQGPGHRYPPPCATSADGVLPVGVQGSIHYGADARQQEYLDSYSAASNRDPSRVST